MSDVSLPRRKETDELLGSEDAWENVDKTQAQCPSCQHNMAYFMQIQIRSADEPMTCFYKCVKCATRWND
jgi:DNA-directed RNA polymerase III subunit RPC11